MGEEREGDTEYIAKDWETHKENEEDDKEQKEKEMTDGKLSRYGRRQNLIRIKNFAHRFFKFHIYLHQLGCVIEGRGKN